MGVVPSVQSQLVEQESIRCSGSQLELPFYGRPVGEAIIFCNCGFFFFLSSFFSLPIFSGRRLDVYHTSTHDMALVQN